MRPTKMADLRRHGVLFAVAAWVALFIFSGSAQAKETLKLTILHMNDIHTHYLPHDGTQSTGPVGGLKRASTVVKEEMEKCRAAGRTPLLLMAGDLLTGTPYGEEYKGVLGVKLMNRMGFKAMVVGNHEFDRGPRHLMEELRPIMNFKLLSANITDESGAYPFARSFEESFPQAEAKMVIFGLTLTDTPEETGKKTKGLEFHDSLRTAKEFLQDYRHEDLVIALTHIGLEQDRKLARKCPKIDVIVGGHSHSVLKKPQRPVYRGPIIVQAGSYSRWVGRLDLDVKDGRVIRSQGRLIQLTSGHKDDPDVVALLEEYPLPPGTLEKIAETRVPLNGERSRRGSKAPNCLGRLVAYLIAKEADADVGLVNQGSVRGNLNAGDIRRYDAKIALPFPNKLVRLTLTGRDLREVLRENSRIKPYKGGILLTHGVDYRITCAGLSIRRVGDEPFDPEKKYVIATNDYLAEGNDGHKELGDRAQDVEVTSTSVFDLFAKFLTKQKVITKQILAKTR